MVMKIRNDHDIYSYLLYSFSTDFFIIEYIILTNIMSPFLAVFIAFWDYFTKFYMYNPPNILQQFTLKHKDSFGKENFKK